MKTHWILNCISSLKYVIIAAFMMLACFGCEKDFEGSSLPIETNILSSEDHWVNPEGTSLIALDGTLYLEFPPGTVTVPTLFTIALVDVENHPREAYNSMDHGISITNASQDLVFGESVNIRMNYALEAFQRSAQVDEKKLTIYKMESTGSLSERQVSIGPCCVDCSCKTVEGCISESGLYVVGELYVVVGI